MNLKDYCANCESNFDEEKNTWKERADTCVQETVDCAINQIKHKIEEQVKNGKHEVLSGVKIKIEYCTSNNYNPEKPHFYGYTSGWTSGYDVFYEWEGISA